jgi:adenosylcobinamide-phosphate synthase
MIVESAIPAILIALACDALFGDPDRLYRRVLHPVVVMGKLIAAADRAWNRDTASTFARTVAGGMTVVLLIVLCVGVGVGLNVLLGGFAYGWIVEGVLMSTLIAQRGLYDHVRAVVKALASEGIGGARAAVAKIVGRETSELDESGIARGAIESLAENFSDAVVAPVFWGLLFGLPGMLVYKAVNTADSMIGHRTPRHLYFGRAAARFDDALSYIPARISALLVLSAASFGARLSKTRGLRVISAEARAHRSVNAGYPEAAMADAIGVRLSGPRPYDGRSGEEAWIGEGFNDARPGDICSALSVYIRACVLLFACVAIAGAFAELIG